jgi:hypothetical protein
MGWFSSTPLPKAEWSLEQSVIGVGYDYELTIAWVLKQPGSLEIIATVRDESHYKEIVPTLRKSYSFPELTSIDWKTLKDKQEVFLLNKERDNEGYGLKSKLNTDIQKLGISKDKAIKEAEELERKKAECRTLLAKGGRRRTKKSYRKKTNKKNSRRHR